MKKEEFMLLDRFFEHSGSWVYDKTLNKIGGVILLSVSLMCYAFPIISNEVESVDRMILIMMVVMEMFGLDMLMKPYISYHYEKKVYMLRDILKALPVSRQTVFRYRMKKLFSCVWKFALLAVAFQVLFTFLFDPVHLAANSLIALGLSVLPPMLFLGLSCGMN